MPKTKDQEPKSGNNGQSGNGQQENDDARKKDQMDAAHIVETTKVTLKNASQQLGYEDEHQLFN